MPIEGMQLSLDSLFQARNTTSPCMLSLSKQCQLYDLSSSSMSSFGHLLYHIHRQSEIRNISHPVDMFEGLRQYLASKNLISDNQACSCVNGSRSALSQGCRHPCRAWSGADSTKGRTRKVSRQLRQSGQHERNVVYAAVCGGRFYADGRPECRLLL